MLQNTFHLGASSSQNSRVKENARTKRVQRKDSTTDGSIAVQPRYCPILEEKTNDYFNDLEVSEDMRQENIVYATKLAKNNPLHISSKDVENDLCIMNSTIRNAHFRRTTSIIM